MTDPFDALASFQQVLLDGAISLQFTFIVSSSRVRGFASPNGNWNFF
jgi:hypothetical protein